jgi:hypothetical protein
VTDVSGVVWVQLPRAAHAGQQARRAETQSRTNEQPPNSWPCASAGCVRASATTPAVLVLPGSTGNQPCVSKTAHACPAHSSQDRAGSRWRMRVVCVRPGAARQRACGRSDGGGGGVLTVLQAPPAERRLVHASLQSRTHQANRPLVPATRRHMARARACRQPPTNSAAAPCIVRLPPATPPRAKHTTTICLATNAASANTHMGTTLRAGARHGCQARLHVHAGHRDVTLFARHSHTTTQALRGALWTKPKSATRDKANRILQPSTADGMPP